MTTNQPSWPTTLSVAFAAFIVVLAIGALYLHVVA